MSSVITYDEWLSDRLGMGETELRAVLEKNLPYYYDDAERPDAVIALYRRKYREEMDIMACEGVDLTFLEWLKIYEHHTPESFHKMCDGTGVSSRTEAVWFNELVIKWQKRRETITGTCPFENKED